MGNNRRSTHKYDEYDRLLSTSTETELVARLAYAEILAANCNEHNSVIARPIVETIANRISRRNQNVKSVVYERDQFASSLNNYGSSRNCDFLCPKDPTLWARVLALTQTALAPGATRSLPEDSVHYYLFRHDLKFSPPDWAQGPNAYPRASFQGSQAVEACAQFFRNCRWERDTCPKTED